MGRKTDYSFDGEATRSRVRHIYLNCPELTIAQIAKRFSVSVPTIYNYTKRVRRSKC